MYSNLNKSRIKVLFIVTLGLFILLSARLVYFQWIKGEYYKGMADKQYNYGEDISSLKYQVLSADGKYLQSYSYKYIVVINIRLFKLNNYENNMDKLMTINYIMKENVKDFDINKLLINNAGNRYYEVNEESYNKLMPLVEETKGIFVYKREVIENMTNSNIVSIITNNKDSKGNLKGEKSLERQLNGYFEDSEYLQAMVRIDKSGYIRTKGFKVPELSYVTLTINKELQDTVEAVLRDERFSKFKQIGAIIIEADTGKVRAMAQKDDYNANINIAANLLGFPPGSTFKLMTAEYALENNIIDVDTMYYCDGKVCNKKTHGYVNMERALNLSCNGYFVELGKNFTAEELQGFCKKQGYLNKVLNLEYEINGKVDLPNEDESNKNFIIGYGISASPIQVAASLSAIVNDGYYTKPYLIEEIKDKDGESVKKFDSTREQVISKENASTIKNYLRTTVLHGTGAVVNLEGIEVGGKTGTAGNPDGDSFREYGWFAGYFKKGNKYYTMVVMVPNIDELKEEKIELQGSNTAGPVFREILKNIKELQF